MTFGELLRDFLRVALTPAEDRWVVMVLGPALRRYISRNSAAWWVEKPGETLTLERSDLEALPKTAREAVGPLEWMLPVTAICMTAEPIDVDLALFAYQVQRPGRDTIAAALIPADVSTSTTSGRPPAVSRRRPHAPKSSPPLGRLSHARVAPKWPFKTSSTRCGRWIAHTPSRLSAQ